MPFFSILIFALVINLCLIIIFLALRTRKTSHRIHGKDRESKIKHANRRLSANPKDVLALETLADSLYEGGEYKKAMHTYDILLSKNNSHAGIDLVKLNLRYGISAMQCNLYQEAYKSLMKAQSIKPDNIEVLEQLGKLEYRNKKYTKALSYLNAVMDVKPDALDCQRFAGLCYYHLKRHSKARIYFEQVLSVLPQDKEIRFFLARCYYEEKNFNRALKMFKILIDDPKGGANAAIFAGIIYAKRRDWEEAIIHYKLGLNHKNIRRDILTELKYQLAEAYHQTQNIQEGLLVLNEIYTINPHFKDVAERIVRFREVNSNKNLQKYLIASSEENIPLYQNLIHLLFPDCTIQIHDIKDPQNYYIDILCGVVTPKIQQRVFLRLMRTEGSAGDLFIREFYTQFQELHADKGIILSAGNFTPEAKDFVGSRLITLIERPQLIEMLKSIKEPSKSHVV